MGISSVFEFWADSPTCQRLGVGVGHWSAFDRSHNNISSQCALSNLGAFFGRFCRDESSVGATFCFGYRGLHVAGLLLGGLPKPPRRPPQTEIKNDKQKK